MSISKAATGVIFPREEPNNLPPGVSQLVQAMSETQYLSFIDKQIEHRRQKISSNPKYKAATWTCKDCGSWADDYMVYDSIWSLAMTKGTVRFLCLICLAARLERPLVIKDFSPVLTNQTLFTGYKIGMGHKP